MNTPRRVRLPLLILLAAAMLSCSPGVKPAAVSGLDELKDKRIGVLIGSTHDQFITSRFPEAEILRLDTSPDLAVALNAGKCDAIIMDANTGRLYRRDDPGLALLAEKIFAENLGFGFADAALRDAFNDFLRELNSGGELDRIRAKWESDSGQSVTPDPPAAGPNGRLRIATSADGLPFTFIKEGRYTGLDIDLAYRFAARQGMTADVQTLPFGSLIASLASGKSEVICSGITITAERAKQVHFSDVYYQSGADALILKKNAAAVSGLEAGAAPAFDAAIIGAMTGSTGEQLVRERFPKADLRLFDDIMDSIAALKTGKLDYVITAYTTALRAAGANQDLVVLPEEYNHEWASIAVHQKNPELLAEIDAILLGFKADGTLEKIIGHWVRPDGSPYEFVKVPKAAGGPPLRVAIAANREPMGFHQGDEIVGLDPELIENVAYRLGRPVVYSDMKFSALVVALESGKADVICSNMTATEERRKRVSFTEGYYVNPQVMLARRSVVAGAAPTEKKGFFAGVKDSFVNNLIREKRYLLIWRGLKVTFLISILSALLGTVIGGLVCWMRMSKRKLPRAIARVYIDLLRGIPQVVLLMIMFYVIFAPLDVSGVLVATITFALNFAAYVSEMFRTSIESVKKGQTEAGIALGFSKVGTFLHIVLPQAVQRVLPVYKGEFIALVKMTAIVGYIAVQDLTKASDIIRSRTFDAFFPLIMVAVLYFVLAWLLTLLLEALQVRTAPKRGGSK